MMPDNRPVLVDDSKILSFIRYRVGANDQVHDFDQMIVAEINTAFNILLQLGFGPAKGFSISGEDETWDQYLSESDPRANMVKTYISSRVKLKFDPPQASYLVDALKEDVAGLEFRLSVQNSNVFPKSDGGGRG